MGWLHPVLLRLLWFDLLDSTPQKTRSSLQLPEITFLSSLWPSFTQAQRSPLPPHPGEAHRGGTLTQADGWFACPAAVCFARAVLRATPEGEALLAGIDERVAHGGQVQGPNVGVGRHLWLLAVVGWMTGKTLLGDEGLQEASPPLPCSLMGHPLPFPYGPLSGPASPSQPQPHPSLDVYTRGQDGDRGDIGSVNPGGT